MKRLADQTLYEILDVSRDAAPPAIEAAYERARSLYGPGSLVTYTLMSAEEAALLTSRIEDAKRTLLDADARARYDAALAASPQPGPGAAPGEGASAVAPAGTPPVIPAVQAERRPLGAMEAPAARAAELLQGAALPPPAACAPIRLEREIPAPPVGAATPPAAEIPMPDGALWTGEALRRVREARGVTVQQIADRTKVTRHHVENIEAERFSALPAPVYLRGILVAIARELRLDGQKVARAYLERAGATAPPTEGMFKPR